MDVAGSGLDTNRRGFIKGTLATGAAVGLSASLAGTVAAGGDATPGRQAAEGVHVYVGTYTTNNRAEGLYVYRMDVATGALTHAHTVTGVDNPSFLALHPQWPYLYAANEVGNYEGMRSGSVSAFAITPTGDLALLNRQATHGRSPAHVSVDPSGRYLLAANYSDGNVAVFPIQADGRLGEASDVVQHEGQGPNARRQAGPHAHFITTDPAGVRVLAVDLGIDKVMVYRLDGTTGTLVPNELPYAQVSSGAGPRHLAFHPNARYVYVINELDSTISAFAYDAERGALQIVQTVSTLPEDFTEASTCAQIVVHPSGRFAYGSNRGHDSIAMFAVDEVSGKLTALGHESTQGRTPRNFNLDPSGTFLYAANQNTNTIVTFRVDQTAGTLTPTGQVTETLSPVCIVFRQA
ncbi:MAG: lactonase family protein [Chloroflexota bacterium]